jgi:hypothetical protein
MSLKRYATRRDNAERPIIEALEQVGFEVWPLDAPCDLICRRSSWAPGIFQMLEVKTGHGKKLTIARDKRQEAQRNFIASTGTPIVRTPLEALKVLGVVI